MIQFKYKIKDPAGIHPRPAGLLINESRKYSSQFTVSLGDKSCDMQKLLALVGLGAQCGDVISVAVSGEDEKVASEEIKKYIKEML